MTIRCIRLVSGLVLLTYLATHFINHAPGLISLEAMEAGRTWFIAFWRGWLATTVLYSALSVDLGPALYSCYQRKHSRMPLWEPLQPVLDLTTPILPAVHMARRRLAPA